MLKKMFVILYYLIFQYFPNNYLPILGSFFRKIRIFVLRRINKNISKTANINRKVYFGFNNIVSIGEYSGIGADSKIQECYLTIKDDVMIGSNLRIYGGGHIIDDISQPMRTKGHKEKTSLLIENDVWIGGDVIITAKVARIGSHSVIGAGSVVTKDVPDYAIVAGNPARVKKMRNE